MNTIGHFIGGRRVVGQSERYADVFNPSTGDVQARVALASARELRDAVLVAKSAQIGWAATNPQRRARVLMKFLEIV
jgi:malonate-semialdehyde dehydrogenase (acetylating)/methylmalonate-semialdehyde dehydrogenase